MTSATRNATSENKDDSPLDLHAEYQLIQECGFANALELNVREAQDIAARVRGISALAAVLLATECTNLCNLGKPMRFGTLEALHILAGDVESKLHQANNRAHEAAQTTRRKGV